MPRPIAHSALSLAPQAALAAKIRLWTPLGPAETAALDLLVGRAHPLPAGAVLAAAGDPLDVATIVVEGLLCRSKLLPDGRRQILSLLLPGDLVDAYPSPLTVRDDNLEAICDARIVTAPHARVAAVSADHPALRDAFLREAFIEGAIAREWVLNVGRRSALEALAHLLCEYTFRMDAVGLGTEGRYPFPMRQQHLADALGLSHIHLNRVLNQLKQAGLMRIDRRSLVVSDPAALCAVAKFSPDYLHTPGVRLSQAAAKAS